MRISVIGTGNVAWHLVPALSLNNEIVTVYGRHIAHAREIAAPVGAYAVDSFAEIDTNSDLYLIAVTDDAIKEIAKEAPRINKGAVWAHTSGSKSMDEILPLKNRGVLYPLQTFSRGVPVSLTDVPVFVEGSTPQAIDVLTSAALEISGNVKMLGSDVRKALHIAAVMSCNFVNHLWSISSEMLEGVGLDFGVLIPLIEASVDKVKHISPKDAQTGPAVRRDYEVIESHLKQLDGDEAEIYRLMTNSIISRQK